ncbi:MAG: chromate efflux transporter [Methylophaga sp.]|nr:chromate efflux transporter [Methylophaga sp.]
MQNNVQGEDNNTTLKVSFMEAFWFWLKLGFISFGGPIGQIAIMHTELVEKRKWISEKRFLHALNFCMLLPGPEAMQLATYVGWLMHKSRGAIVAGLLFILPSLILLMALALLYLRYSNLPVVEALFYGIKPAVVAIVFFAAYRIAKKTLKTPQLMLITALAFVALYLFHLPFPLIILSAAVLGYLFARIKPTVEHSSPDFDSHTQASHTRFSWRQSGRVLIIGLVCWFVPMGALYLILGWDHSLTQMGWFFTKAAFLTFGGAYAVLPYVYQGAVSLYGWVTPVQMMDGLALGESTPGPLIMIVAFVGFIAGYMDAFWGPDASLWAGVLAAVLVTWFTFLPSFVFVLMGGPLIESSFKTTFLNGPLTGISAAVVGVVFSLGMFFAEHALWPEQLEGAIDGWSALILLASMIALVKLRIGIMPVLGLSALAGVGLQMFL